jgi:hypothetical protein
MKCSFAVIYVFDYTVKVDYQRLPHPFLRFMYPGIYPRKNGVNAKTNFSMPNSRVQTPENPDVSAVKLLVRRDHDPGTVSKPVNL